MAIPKYTHGNAKQVIRDYWLAGYDKNEIICSFYNRNPQYIVMLVSSVVDELEWAMQNSTVIMTKKEPGP